MCSPCKHCGARPGTCCRGLCNRCGRLPAIRRLYARGTPVPAGGADCTLCRRRQATKPGRRCSQCYLYGPPAPCADCGRLTNNGHAIRCADCAPAFCVWLYGCETPHPETEARIRRYRARAERQLPLFA